MKQSNVIKGTLAVVALVAALVVGVAVHMHSVGSPTAGHSTQNTAKTAESITADYPGSSSAEEGVMAAGRAGDRHPGACHQSHQGRRESRRHH